MFILHFSFLILNSHYFIEHVKATGYSCRTHLPPNTAFCGFGSPQAVFVIEAAMFKAAEKMGVAPSLIQKKNLLKTGAEFAYGMKVENSQASRCWEKVEHEIEKKVQILTVNYKEVYNKGFKPTTGIVYNKGLDRGGIKFKSFLIYNP